MLKQTGLLKDTKGRSRSKSSSEPESSVNALLNSTRDNEEEHTEKQGRDRRFQND